MMLGGAFAAVVGVLRAFRILRVLRALKYMPYTALMAGAARAAAVPLAMALYIMMIGVLLYYSIREHAA